MIARDFIYIRPDTKEEAAWMYKEGYIFYGGGSEIISMCRTESISPDGVIDLKSIPDANTLKVEGGNLIIGACVTLRGIKDSGLFPLMGLICGRIADHTNQCRITLGGNICGTIIYREALQSLLLTDADLVLFGQSGARKVPVHSVFDGRIRLAAGEFVLQAHIPIKNIGGRFNHIKKTGHEKIDYPLISVSTLRVNGGLRLAVSGLTQCPFRSEALESILNDERIEHGLRVKKAMEALDSLPYPPLSDRQASAEYRLFVFERTLEAIMEEERTHEEG